MVFLAQCSISLLDVSFRSGFVNVQEFIVVFGAEDERNDIKEDEKWKVEHFATRGGRLLVASINVLGEAVLFASAMPSMSSDHGEW